MKIMNSQPNLPAHPAPDISPEDSIEMPDDLDNFELPPLKVVKIVKTRFRLVAPLPPEFELTTTYTAAVCATSTQPESAAALIALMASADTTALRLACGFED